MPANQKKAVCPGCGKTVPYDPKKEPYTCVQCGQMFNAPVIGVMLPLNNLEPEVTKQTFSAAGAIGQWFLNGFQHLIWDLKFVIEPEQGRCGECTKAKLLEYEQAGRLLCDPCAKKAAKKKEAEPINALTEAYSGECADCAMEKKLLYELDGENICAPCGNGFLFGKRARSMLMPIAQKRFSYVPRQTIFEGCYKTATSLAETWFKQNWSLLYLKARNAAHFEACKGRALALPPLPGEPREITHIRMEWAEGRRAQCIIPHLDNKVRGRDIENNHHRRRARRKRFRDLNKQFAARPNGAFYAETYKPDHGKKRPKWKTSLHDFVYQVAGPVCGDGKCPHFKYYSWGWECDLESKRPDRFPTFPTTVLPLHKGTYRITEDTVSIGLWEHHVYYPGTIDGARKNREWLRRYEYGGLDSDPYAKLLRRPDDKGETDRHSLIRPTTYTVPVIPGDFVHYVLNGPRETIVVSLKNAEREGARFHHHARIPKMKAYYGKKRAEAQAGVKLPKALNGNGGITFNIPECIAAAVYLRKALKDEGVIGSASEVPETYAAFEVWFREQDEALRARILEQAGQRDRIRLLHDAIRALCSEGALHQSLPVPVNRKFLAWYDRMDEDFRTSVEDKARELEERRSGAAATKAAKQKAGKNIADGEEDNDSEASPEEEKKGRSGYFKNRPRNKERRAVNLELHEEARAIIEGIFEEHGEVVLVCPEIHPYGRGEDERRELNDRLHAWPESIFRGHFSYKARLAGFNYRECAYDLGALAVCPCCGAELGGTWQAWLIEHEADNATCHSCETTFNLLEGIVSAMRALPEQKRKTRKEKRKERKGKKKTAGAEALDVVSAAPVAEL